MKNEREISVNGKCRILFFRGENDPLCQGRDEKNGTVKCSPVVFFVGRGLLGIFLSG